MATEWVNDIHQGDAGETLAEMPESSVHMCMTSPPYWNLRDYGEDGQLGLEKTAEEYVNNIAGVCEEIYRVLREDGSLWLNLGDTYDNKDLQQIPARVSLELQARGWTPEKRDTKHRYVFWLPDKYQDKESVRDMAEIDLQDYPE